MSGSARIISISAHAPRQQTKILHLGSLDLKQSDMNVDYYAHNSFAFEMIMTYITREMEYWILN